MSENLNNNTNNTNNNYNNYNYSDGSNDTENKNEAAENLSEAENENEKAIHTDNTNDEAPLVIYKNENAENNSGSPANSFNPKNMNTLQERFYAGSYYQNNTAPEDSYNKLTSKEDNNSNNINTNPRNNVYRWNYKDEENTKINKNNNKNTKATKSAGLKIFAAVMSVMFLFSAVMSGVLLINRFSPEFEITSESPAPVISNQKAIDESSPTIEDTSIMVPKEADTKNANSMSVPEVISKMKPSVVCIQVEFPSAYGGRFFGRGDDYYAQEGVGTGFILTSDGYIATNYHVVDNASRITVTLDSGESYGARLIGGDEVADLAVIKIDAKGLPTAELGNSDAAVEGEYVVAIGNPGGIEFMGSSTLGIVSAVNRTVDITPTRQMTVIQTDASINPGNSGGPLVNMKGQVIGINTLKLSSSLYEGMGFAIPINSSIDTLNDIISNPGTINRESGSNSNRVVDRSNASFDITGITVTAEEAEEKRIPQGWRISEIDPNGACANTGLQTSDIIIALDGRPVTSYDDLASLKLNYEAGDKVIVTVYRNGDEHDFEVILSARK